MKKSDLHIHTVSTKRDKPFEFSIEKLKGYVIQEKVDLIAITNHNLFDAQQFSDITNALPIKVFPGIEVDIEAGHLIVITDPSDIDDFTEKCAKVYRLNGTSEDSYISEAQFMEIFNNLGKYILIPHYEKDPKLSLERVPQISPYIKCGEACSAKKFIYMQSKSEKLVPVLFSDWRVEEKAQFPSGRQTYIDIDDINMMSLKYACSLQARSTQTTQRPCAAGQHERESNRKRERASRTIPTARRKVYDGNDPDSDGQAYDDLCRAAGLCCRRWAAVLRQLQNSQGSVLSEWQKTVWA